MGEVCSKNQIDMKTIIIVALTIIIISCREKHPDAKIVITLQNNKISVLDSIITVKYVNESKDSLFSAIKLLHLQTSSDKGRELLTNVYDSCYVDVFLIKVESKLNQMALNKEFKIYGNSFLSNSFDRELDLLFGVKSFEADKPSFVFLPPKTTINIYYKIKNNCKVPIKKLSFFENSKSNKLYDLYSSKKYQQIVENSFKGYRFVIP